MEERTVDGAIEDIKGLIVKLMHLEDETDRFNTIIEINNDFEFITDALNDLKEYCKEERRGNYKNQLIVRKLSMKLEELGVSTEDIIK